MDSRPNITTAFRGCRPHKTTDVKRTPIVGGQKQTFYGTNTKKNKRRRITGLKTCAFRDFRLFSPRCVMHILNIPIRAQVKSKHPLNIDNNDILKNCNAAAPAKFYVCADGVPVYWTKESEHVENKRSAFLFVNINQYI
tara:strand:+ start:2764 stop:3180 length:417 start_codon:yes stop_codon:yes gene_type:complete